MRVIFVPVADRPECVTALNTAFSLAQSVGASVVGCHIRPHRDSPIALPARLGMYSTGNEEVEWQLSAKPENGRKAEAAAGVLFSHLAQSHGYELLRRPRATPGAVWMEKTGSPGKVIGIMGPVSDLLVISRPANTGGTIARIFLSAALLKSSRPILVVPQGSKTAVGKRICIAWNQSGDAARAVTAAMPLLQQADEVTILSHGPETKLGPSSAQLGAYLKYWGIKSKHIAGRGKDERKDLLQMYRSSGSDLLVMGAYSRNRMRQMIFGGVTEFMLEHAAIPVFMLHA